MSKKRGGLYTFIVGEALPQETKERMRRSREERHVAAEAMPKKEHSHVFSKIALALGGLDALLSVSLLLGGVMTAEYVVGFAVRFVLWVVLPILFLRGTFDR